MTMRSLILFIFLAAPAATRAERAAVLPVTGINVHEGYLKAAQEILRGHIQRTGKYQVVDLVTGPAAEREPNAGEAVAQARSVGADVAVVAQITRLGNTARVRMTVYGVASGRTVHWDEMPAGTPDDIDPVLERLARGLATGKAARDSADIETVTEPEADPLMKRRATSSFGLQLGMLVPMNRPPGGEDALPGLGVFWLYDMRWFLADVTLGFHNKEDAGDFWVGIGMFYPFQRTDFTPYLGGGVRYAWVDYGGEGASGLSLHATGGVLLGRLSSVQMRGEVGWFFNAFGERDEDAFGAPEGREHYSHGPEFSLGIGF